LVTEADVRDVAPGSEIVVPPDALVTPLARDLVLERNLRLTSEGRDRRPAASTVPTPDDTQPTASPEKTVALGADHGGLALKEVLKSYFQELGYVVLDCGTHSSESVDYPDVAYSVAGLVSEGRAARGVMVDGAGIGSCMAANKVPGVRAAMCYDVSTAVNSREHNDANVLTLGGGLIGNNLARQIVKTWLSTDFGGGRHARRVNKIMAIEQRYLKK
jgi:ribose 5-phosphate isomerase B